MIKADLHIHTFYSDGSQTPFDVAEAAKRNGVNLISVTDHDNSFSRKEAAVCAKQFGISYVDGEEVSSYYEGHKIHVLCYGMDYSSAEYVAFNKRLIEGAEERAFDILKKLSASGINVSYGDVIRERRYKKSPIHAMYIASAGARKGYASSPSDFYARYLNRGKAGYSCICRPTPDETVRVATACGGFCSLAHPGRITLNCEELVALVKKLKDCGLGGIEAVYSGHTDSQTQYYKELAKSLDLLITGGSDTHYAEGRRQVGEPPFYPDEKLLAALKIN